MKLFFDHFKNISNIDQGNVVPDDENHLPTDTIYMSQSTTKPVLVTTKYFLSFLYFLKYQPFTFIMIPELAKESYIKSLNYDINIPTVIRKRKKKKGV